MTEIKIKYVCKSIGSGGTPDSANPSFYSDDVGFNWMTIKDMDNCETSRTKMLITREGLLSKKLTIYKKGTLLYSIYATLGRTLILPFDSTVNQAILALTPNKKVSVSFLKYSLDSKENEILREASTSTQANLSLAKVQNFFIPNISRDMQDEICNFLDSKSKVLDKLIANLESQIVELRNFKLSFIEEKVHSGPKNMKIKFIALTKSKKSEIDGLPYFALENIESNTGMYQNTNSNYSSIGGIICEKDDVCFGKLRPYLNKYYLVKDKCTCSSEIAVFKELNHSKFLYYVIQSPMFLQYCIGYSEGTKMPRINIEYIKNWKFFFPSFERQKQIVNEIEQTIGEVEKLIELKKEKIEDYKKLKKTLIFEWIHKSQEAQI